MVNDIQFFFSMFYLFINFKNNEGLACDDDKDMFNNRSSENDNDSHSDSDSIFCANDDEDRDLFQDNDPKCPQGKTLLIFSRDGSSNRSTKFNVISTLMVQPVKNMNGEFLNGLELILNVEDKV